MKCKHENADHLKPGEGFVDDGLAAFGPYTAKCEQFRCLDCGAWLSLGLANDADEHVAIEIRAAEIAARKHDMMHRLSMRFKTNYGEMTGWHEEETIESLHVIDADGSKRIDHDVPLNLDSPNWRAGYLARQIAIHE